jgi:hypothetical protein
MSVTFTDTALFSPARIPESRKKWNSFSELIVTIQQKKLDRVLLENDEI